MIISWVRWGRTVNVGNYESVRLDVEGVVPTGGSAESTLEQLQRWVDEYAPMTPDEWERNVDQRNRARMELADLHTRVEAARREWDGIVSFFKTNGLAIPQSAVEDLPF